MITVKGEQTANKWGSVFFIVNGNLTIESGKYSSNAGFAVGTTHGVSNSPKITIKGGTFTSTDDTVFYLAGEGNDLTIEEGNIVGERGGIEIRSGKITMTGGSIIANGQPPAETPTPGKSTKACSAITMTWQSAYQSGTTIAISGGNVKSTYGAAILNHVDTGAAGTYSVSISGTPTLEGKSAIIGKGDDTVSEVISTITGGTFVVHTFDDLKKYLEAGVNVKLGGAISTTFASHSLVLETI